MVLGALALLLVPTAGAAAPATAPATGPPPCTWLDWGIDPAGAQVDPDCLNAWIAYLTQPP